MTTARPMFVDRLVPSRYTVGQQEGSNETLRKTSYIALFIRILAKSSETWITVLPANYNMPAFPS